MDSNISEDQVHCRGQLLCIKVSHDQFQYKLCNQKPNIIANLLYETNNKSVRLCHYEKRKKEDPILDQFLEDFPAYEPISELFQTLQTQIQMHLLLDVPSHFFSMFRSIFLQHERK